MTEALHLEMSDAQKAISIAENLFNKDGEIDIVKLAHDMNLEVFTSKKMSSLAEIFYENNEKWGEKFEIIIQKLPSLERQRFSIAHEIAHFCLHKDLLRQYGVIDREGVNSLDRKYEMEADNLAGQILMPENCIKKVLTDLGLDNCFKLEDKSITDIAKKFQVSKVAASIRLRDLGYSVRFV